MNKPSPIVLSLLLAATLGVDAVAAYWLSAGSGETALAFYFGLMFGNLSVLCVWATRVRRGSRLAWLVPFFAGLLIAALSVGLLRAENVLDFIGLFWIHVATLLASLWIWSQTRFARPVGQTPAEPTWQVSVLQLLIVTTIAAVILSVWANSTALQRSSDISWVPWDINNIAVALAAVVIFSRPWSLIARTAAVAAAALGCGVLMRLAIGWMDGSLGGTSFPFWQNLFHAGVLLVWLQLGGISSRAVPESSDEISRQ